MLPYQNAAQGSRRPTLVVDGDEVVLTLPAPSPWWERLFLIGWALNMGTRLAVPAYFISTLQQMPASRPSLLLQAFPRWWFVAMSVEATIVGAIFAAWLYQHCRYAGTPRQLRVAAGRLTYRRRVIWGIRERRHALCEVTDVFIQTKKDLFGRRPRTGTLIVRVRRQCALKVALDRSAYAMSQGIVDALRHAVDRCLHSTLSDA